MYLLAIDIGNTNITIGVFQEKKLLHSWRLATERNKTVDDYGLSLLGLLAQGNLPTEQISGLAIGSVVPQLDNCFAELSRKYFHRRPFFVNPGNVGIKILYHNPEEVGADRLVNALAGYELLGGPVIIIDFGTAITFDCVNKTGDYLGGLIFPGMKMATESLAENTAKLPKIEFSLPKNIVGKTTTESINSGIFYGYTGMIKEVISALKKVRVLNRAKVIATGGLGNIIIPHLRRTIKKFIPELTLQGIRLAWGKNYYRR